MSGWECSGAAHKDDEIGRLQQRHLALAFHISDHIVDSRHRNIEDTLGKSRDLKNRTRSRREGDLKPGLRKIALVLCDSNRPVSCTRERDHRKRLWRLCVDAYECERKRYCKQ